MQKLSKPGSVFNLNEHNAEYIRIPGGSYIHSVTGEIEGVSDLYVAKYPVTNKLFNLFIASLKSGDPGFLRSLKNIALKGSWGSDFAIFLKMGELSTLFQSKFSGDGFCEDDQPAVGMNLYAAKAYCVWLSQRADQSIWSYRLPTEIEWEWAAGGKRGESVQGVRSYPWGEAKGELTPELANYGQNVGHTTAVSNYPEGTTPEGLYGMMGNVAEWMENGALRGVGWKSSRKKYSIINRETSIATGWSNDIGFRVALDPKLF